MYAIIQFTAMHSAGISGYYLGVACLLLVVLIY